MDSIIICSLKISGYLHCLLGYYHIMFVLKAGECDVLRILVTYDIHILCLIEMQTMNNFLSIFAE